MKPSKLILALFAGILGLLGGCAKKEAASKTAALPKVIVQLDWVAEPEHGGFYQAQARGWFQEAGLDVELLPGGAGAHVQQKLAAGQAHIGQSDSTNAILGISNGAPLMHIGAVFQNDPSVLMLHADNPVSRFEDLNGKVIMARPEWAFLGYVRKKYGIDFKIIPQNFSVANFIVDKNFIQQGFYIAEPYHIVKGGAQSPKFLYAWDAGFDAYTVILANSDWAAKNPEVLKAFMKAYIRGWRDYIEGDPTPAHELMKKANANNTDEFLAYSRKMIIDEKLVIGRNASDSKNIGRITPERFQNQINQLEDLGMLPKGKVRVDQVMTTAYLP